MFQSDLVMAASPDTSHVEQPGAPEAARRAEIDAAYHVEMGRILRRRLHLTTLLFLLFVGIGVCAERIAYPGRARFITTV